MKQKILKLIKNLERFKIEDIITLTELDKDVVSKYINELLEENKISKISENIYAYVPEIHSIIQPQLKKADNKDHRYLYNIEINKDIITEISPKKLFSSSKELKIFNEQKDYNKRNIVRVLTILKLAWGLKGNKLKEFLNKLGEKHHKYKISYCSYIRYRYKYFKYGIKGLCLNYYSNNRTARSAVSPEMYEEFKKYYLSPKRYSCSAVHRIVVQKFPDCDVPNCISFKRLLAREYTHEQIEQLRSIPVKLPDLGYGDRDKVNNKPKNNKILFDKFIDAANYHYNLLDKQKTEGAICQKGYLKNHIIPYFKKYTFDEITQEVITNYQSKMIAEGYTMASLKRFLSLISIIFTKYSASRGDLYFSFDSPIETGFYNKDEIKNIIMNNKPELWILALGITPAELSVLRYEDIDFTSKTIFIQRSLFHGTEQTHRAKYRQRHLKLPSILLKDIKQQNGLIFGNVDIQNYDKLLNTHIHLLLEHHVQINIISKNLGFHTVNNFVMRYNFLLPQKLDEDFEILPKI